MQRSPRSTRRAMLLSALGLIVLLVAIGFWGQGTLEQRRLRRAAASFVEQAPEQAEQLRKVFTRPAHDIRAEQRQVRQQIAGIVEELRLDPSRENPSRRGTPRGSPGGSPQDRDPAGARAEGASLGGSRLQQSQFQVGRLYQAIGDHRSARYFLDLAHGIDRGPGYVLDDPEVAFARGLTHGELALRAQRWSEILTNDSAPSASRQAAIASFEWARGRIGPRQAWADAFLAHLEGRHERALELLAQRQESFEDQLLLGRVWASLARSEWRRGRVEPPGEMPREMPREMPGDDSQSKPPPAPTAVEAAAHATALAAVRAADSSFRRALEKAPSDPRSYLGLCDLWSAMLSWEVWRSSPEQASAHHARAEVACTDGLRVQPDSIPLLVERLALDASWWAYRSRSLPHPSSGAEMGSTQKELAEEAGEIARAAERSRQMAEGLVRYLEQLADGAERGAPGREVELGDGLFLAADETDWQLASQVARYLADELAAIAEADRPHEGQADSVSSPEG